MTTLMQANKQWANRPTDERFTSLIDLNQHCKNQYANSRARVVATRDIEAIAPDKNTLQLVGRAGQPIDVSHWGFGQLAQRAAAPANYLRTLPAQLAADNINYGLRFARDSEDIGLLFTRTDTVGGAILRAATGPQYGRVWNATITESLVNRFGDGVTGNFRVPGEFGKAINVTQDNTTLYAGDRDMFVFLADEERRIEVHNRRDGQSGSLARGFFVWNSEVGSATFGCAMFLFDYACSNRIVWGAQDYREVRVRHTKSAPHRLVEEVEPAITAFARASADPVRRAIEAAQSKRVDNIDAFLRSRKFNNSQVEGIKAAHAADEGRPMETLWDVTTGVTAYARGISWQDDRVAVERIGGEIMALAA
jgi:hypothetical protein